MTSLKDLCDLHVSWEIQDSYKLHNFVTIITKKEDADVDVNSLVNNYNWSSPTGRLMAFLHPELVKSDKCELRLSLSTRHQMKISQIRLLSNARHVELYDRSGEYTATIKGRKRPATVTNDQQVPATPNIKWFECEVVPSTDCCETLIKMVGLADVSYLALRHLWIVLEPCQWPGPEAGVMSGGLINMDRVTELLGGDTSQLTPQAKQLLASVDQAQKGGNNSNALLAGLMAQANLSGATPRSASFTGLTRESRRSDEFSASSSSAADMTQLKDWIDSRLTVMETRINSKLDTLADRLRVVEQQLQSTNENDLSPISPSNTAADT